MLDFRHSDVDFFKKRHSLEPSGIKALTKKMSLCRFSSYFLHKKNK